MLKGLGSIWLGFSKSTRAALFMVAAMICFGSMPLFIRLASFELHALEIVFFRNFLALLLMVPWLCQRGMGVMRTRRIGLYTARSVINVIAMAAGFTAVTLIPLAEATALGFTAPLWATLGAVVLLGEVIRARRITALAVGFLGMLIVLRPGIDAVSFGAALALGNAFLIAMTALIVKRLTETEPSESIVTWMVLLQTPLALIPALFVWEWPSLLGWGWLWALAIAGTVGHLCWTRAYTIAEVSQLQPFEFLKLPMIGFFAYLIFAETPSIWTWIGGTVIFSSTAYISVREARLSKQRAGETQAR